MLDESHPKSLLARDGGRHGWQAVVFRVGFAFQAEGMPAIIAGIARAASSWRSCAMRLKGELSPAGLDAAWHQVALPAGACTERNTEIIREFCRDLPLCARGHMVMWEDVWYNVYCFKE